MVEPVAGKTWVYGATPKVEAIWAGTAWPRVERERTEIQAHSCQRLMAHGALKTNYGRQPMVTADRPQPRAREHRERSLATAQQRVDKPAAAVKATQDQVAVSESQGQGKRLAQRQAAWAGLALEWQAAQHQPTPWAEQGQAMGPSGQRAARACRTQTLMTMRTLGLEKTVRAFMVALLGTLPTKVRVETSLHLLFERRGARLETSSQVLDGGNTAGLAVPYRHLRTKVVAGLWAMALQDQGKPI